MGNRILTPWRCILFLLYESFILVRGADAKSRHTSEIPHVSTFLSRHDDFEPALKLPYDPLYAKLGLQ